MTSTTILTSHKKSVNDLRNVAMFYTQVYMKRGFNRSVAMKFGWAVARFHSKHFKYNGKSVVIEAEATHIRITYKAIKHNGEEITRIGRKEAQSWSSDCYKYFDLSKDGIRCTRKENITGIEFLTVAETEARN